jgi:hypothetical protein
MRRPKKYDVAEQKELIDVFLRVRPVPEGQKTMIVDSSPTSIVVPTKVLNSIITRLFSGRGRSSPTNVW